MAIDHSSELKPLFVIHFQMAEGVTEAIPIHYTDTLDSIATSLCRKYSISKDKVNYYSNNLTTPL